MSIVLNEREWAESAIANRQLGNKPTETLDRIARYYYQSAGYKKKDIRDKLEDFMLQCDPNITLIKWSNTLDRIVHTAGKYPLIELDGVDITKNELDSIGSLDGKQLQRLAFTALCNAKYWNAVRSQNNNWVNTPDKELMRMANINTSIQRQCAMFNTLNRLGLIRFSQRIDNLNIQVRFITHSSAANPVELHIDDFRNLGNQYSLYKGDPFIRCAQCGLVVPKRGNAHKYCSSCAAEMYLKKSIESVMRSRVSKQN